MRIAIALILLLTTLAACEGGPAGTRTARDPAYSGHYGGMCSPYASNCW